MKNSLKIVLFVLLLCGVFGADEDEVKSVLEGDSVTLNPDPTEIQGFIKIQWRFGETLVAQTRGIESSYEDEVIFKDRLELNQTGTLTIKNMRTKHSGLYKLQISHNAGTSYQKFRVTVNESPFVDDIKFVMKNVSVKEGDSVTLDAPQLHGDELIVWRFGDEGKLIAKHDIEAKNSSLYNSDERFRERLQLDQTGSLIITNTRTTDSGLYTVKISSNKQTYKRFTLTVSAVPDSVPGLSPAAVAGIVVVVLLVSAAAAAAGVMYFCRSRTTNLPNQTWSVLDGQSVILDPDIKIQTGDQIQLLFGDEDTLIAEIKGETREMPTYDGPDKRFRNKLKLDKTTGSLTITNITTKHSGVYTLKIRRGRETLYKRFFISVRAREIAVMEGESVTLKPDPEINKGDLILWQSVKEKQHTVCKEQHSCIATFIGKTGETFTYDYVAGGRFRDILELNKTTGSLTIKNTRTEHSGVYKLEIRSSSQVSYQTFIVTVNDKVEEKLLKEDDVTLNPDTEIQRDDLMLWMFGDQDHLIAQIRGGTVEIFDDGINKRFKGRLKLDEKTGSLTITNITTAHTGLYKLQIISSSRRISFKKFKVLIKLRYELAGKEGPVRLYTLNHEVQTDDEIQWMFGDEKTPIAGIKGGKTYVVPDERFRDKLELDKTTGSLTIKNYTSEHAGHYKQKICSSEGKTNRTYIVIISNEVREKSEMKEKNDSTENRVNESATVVMPLLNRDDLDEVNEGEYVNVMNEEEGTSSL